MTIGVAWIRRDGAGESLWIASDSRLSDDYVWDTCPKLIALPRRDAVAGFSGTTAQAYPLLLQIANAISSYYPARDGTMDFLELINHLQRLVNAMMESLTPDPHIRGAGAAGRAFGTFNDALVIGGYSRMRNCMILRVLRYQGDTGQWRFERVRPKSFTRRSGSIVIYGDGKARNRYVFLLSRLLASQSGIQRTRAFNFEPLEILTEMLRMPTSTASRLPMDRRPITIGGPPQILCAMPGAQATAVATEWEIAGERSVYLQGRPTFSYERLTVPLATFGDSGVSIHAPNMWPANVAQAE
jgi:hypothetical protein